MKAIEEMTDVELREELKMLGCSPGPIVNNTRNPYRRKLRQLRAQDDFSVSPPPSPAPPHSTRSSTRHSTNQATTPRDSPMPADSTMRRRQEPPPRAEPTQIESIQVEPPRVEPPSQVEPQPPNQESQHEPPTESTIQTSDVEPKQTAKRRMLMTQQTKAVQPKQDIYRRKAMSQPSTVIVESMDAPLVVPPPSPPTPIHTPTQQTRVYKYAAAMHEPTPPSFYVPRSRRVQPLQPVVVESSLSRVSKRVAIGFAAFSALLALVYCLHANSRTLKWGIRIFKDSISDTVQFFFIIGTVAAVSALIVFVHRERSATHERNEREKWRFVELAAARVRAQGSVGVAAYRLRDLILPLVTRSQADIDNWAAAVEHINNEDSRICSETRIVRGVETDYWTWAADDEDASSSTLRYRAFDRSLLTDISAAAINYSFE